MKKKKILSTILKTLNLKSWKKMAKIFLLHGFNHTAELNSMEVWFRGVNDTMAEIFAHADISLKKKQYLQML